MSQGCLKEKDLRVVLKDINLKVALRHTVNQIDTEHQVLLALVLLQEEYTKEKEWLEKWVTT